MTERKGDGKFGRLLCLGYCLNLIHVRGPQGCWTRIDFFQRRVPPARWPRKLYDTVRDLPIISPHGHTDPQWFADNQPFPNPACAVHSAGPLHFPHAVLAGRGAGVDGDPADGTAGRLPIRARCGGFCAKHYYLFRGTPTRLWLDYAFQEQFGLTERLSPKKMLTSITTFIDSKLRTPEFLPRALFESFKIEVLATTDAAVDTLEHHRKIKASGWKGRVVPTFRPDAVVDAEYAGFQDNLRKLGEVSGEDVSSWKGYLAALRKRRAFFKENGATATDHGHLTALTADLSANEAAAICMSESMRARRGLAMWSCSRRRC